MPRYALGDVASAYLYLRQPEQAAAIYQQVAQAEESHDDDPVDRLGNQTGRYYAGRGRGFRRRSQVMDETREGYPAWLTSRASPCASLNDLHLQSMQVDAGARLQADDTPEAQARLEGMARNAPNNSTLKSELARCIAPAAARASERTLKMAETLTPRNIGVENGQGFTALALQEWRQAEALSRDTLARAPENCCRRLAREWAVHQGRAAHRRLPWPGL